MTDIAESSAEHPQQDGLLGAMQYLADASQRELRRQAGMSEAEHSHSGKPTSLAVLALRSRMEDDRAACRQPVLLLVQALSVAFGSGRDEADRRRYEIAIEGLVGLGVPVAEIAEAEKILYLARRSLEQTRTAGRKLPIGIAPGDR